MKNRSPKYFDIVNEDDEVIGTASAQECHSNPELLHRVVHFTIIDAIDETVLVGKRPPHNAFDGGKWCFFGEHVLAGEHYLDAFVRGLKDELGLENISGGSWSESHIFSYASQRELAKFLIAYYHKDMNIHLDADEVEKTKWIKINELSKHTQQFSEITKYWAQHAWWKKALSFAKKGW